MYTLWLREYWERIDTDLAGRRHATGSEFSICDIYLYVMARWYVDVHGRISGEGLERFAQLRAAYAHSALVEIEKFDDPLPPVTAFKPPPIVER